VAGEECMVAKQNEDFVLDAIRIWRSEDLINYVLADLDTRVKKDRAVKLSVFFTGLSSHLKEPINLFLKGESGSGKTYNTTETLRYFPQENIWYLGGMSQKALVHDHGILLNKNGEPIDIDKKPIKPKKSDFQGEGEFQDALSRYNEDAKLFREEMRESYTLIDLSNKILVFLEAPDFYTFQALRPILSHDKEEITFKFVDRTGRGQLKTMTVVLKGWPATVFLTTNTKYIEELTTRSFTATPESTEVKILEANVLTNLKMCYPWQYSVKTLEFQIIEKLIQSLQNNLSENRIDVVIPFKNLYELFPKEISRDMRDFQHFTQFLKTITLLHYFQRPYMKQDKTQYLIATFEDVERALDVYKELFETTRTGMEKRILDFYHKCVAVKTIIDEKGKETTIENPSWYLSELTAKYNEKAKKKLSEERIRVMLDNLDNIGYVNTQKDAGDKRKNVYVPLVKEKEKDTNVLKIDSCSDSKAKLEKGFKSWLENILGKTCFYINKNFEDKPGTWGESEITPEELSKHVLETGNIFVNIQQSIPRIISNEESKPNTEIKSETNHKPETRTIVDNSTTKPEINLGIPCPHCQAQGKKVFFANDVDLRTHISAYHETQEYVR
jgi:hypothetical protein